MDRPEEAIDLKYQIGTSSSGHGGRRCQPFVFTERGATIAANLLRSCSSTGHAYGYSFAAMSGKTIRCIFFLCCGGLLFDAEKEFLHAQGVELQSAARNRNERKPSATPAPAIPSSINVPFDLPSLVRQVRGAVVLISVYDRNGKLRGKGTGFFVSSDSIATNAHVIEGAVTVRAKAEDGTAYDVTQVYGCDPALDVAILKTTKDSGKTVRLQSDDNVEVGERIAVIGNPLGAFENTVSDGIISGLRKDEAGDWLQITAAVSPGSSGSPVINASGGVVGIVALGFTQGQSLNFARPSKYLASMPRTPVSFAEIAEQLKQRVISNPDYKAGLDAFSQGDMLTAIRRFKQALAKFPDNLIILDLLGHCYQTTAAERLSEDDPTIPKASEQEFREAVRLYKRILSLDQNNISALEALAAVCGFLKLSDEVIATCRRGLTLDDSNANLWLSMAFAFADKGDLDRAEDAAERAVKFNPRDSNAWGALATIYHMDGKFRQEANTRTREAAAEARSSSAPHKSPSRSRHR